MNHLRNHFFLLGLMSLVAMPVFADENTAILPENLEEDVPVEFIPTLDTTVTVGLRRLNNGPKVRFDNLGSLNPTPAASAEDYTKTSENFVSHFYTNGYVLSDAVRGTEKNGAGTQLSSGESFQFEDSYLAQRNGNVVTVFTKIATTGNRDINPTALRNPNDGAYIPNTRSIVNPDGSISQVNDTTWAATGRYLAYDKNQTRTWGVLNKSQIKPDGTVHMHSDSVITAGASLQADSSASTGFDIAIERRLGKRGKLDWGVSAGVKFSYVNAKATGVFPAYLVRTTDVYTLVNTGRNGAFLPNGTNNGTINTTQPGGDAADLRFYAYDPSYNPATDASNLRYIRYVDGSTIQETTENADESYATPLDVASVQWGTPSIAGTVMIHGNYQLKGAYLLAHVGPTFRYNFNDRWSVSGTFGLALGWTGTNFKSTEYYNTWNDLPGNPAADPTLGIENGLRPDVIENMTEYHWSESVATHKFSPGLYFDLNAEYWVTDRTAFFTGISGQALRSYNSRKLSGRTATVEATKNAGWTIGIRTRF